MPSVSGKRLEPGIILLLFQVFKLSGRNDIPPVTLSVIAGMVAMYLRLISVPWSPYDVCLSGRHIFDGDFRRLAISAFEHADDMHLYYNMASFMWKGISLEKHFSSQKFAFILVLFVISANFTYVLIAWTLSQVLDDFSYMEECAVGFSGVIFALKVLTTHYMPEGTTISMFGFSFHPRWAVWLELVMIQVLVPRVSGIGHLAGILVGLAYVHGPLKLFDSLL